MTHVLIRHRVDSFDDWKAVFENFADVRKSSGELSYQVLRKDEDSENLYLLFEWDTTDNAREFLESSRLKETMEKAGVTEAPEIHFLNEAIRGTL